MHKEKWRLIVDHPRRGSMNMAVDYAILNSLSDGESLPTIRFYKWDNPTITIGYSQDLMKVIHIDQCELDGIDFIRRITGGGTIFHQYEITYSIMVPLDSNITRGTIVDSYRKICLPIVKALRKNSIEAEYFPDNNIIVKGKKISGSSQIRRNGVLLQHGTILLDIESDRMFRYLRIEKDNNIDKKNKKSPLQVSSLMYFLGKVVLTEEFQSKLIQSIWGSMQSEFLIDLEEGALSEIEIEMSMFFDEKIFGNPQWNKNRQMDKVLFKNTKNY